MKDECSVESKNNREEETGNGKEKRRVGRGKQEKKNREDQ